MSYVAEYVLPGHPDKLCDAVADALVQEAGRRERRALCGVEVAVHRSAVFVTGRIACSGAKDIDVGGIVRSVYGSAGYGGPWKPDAGQLKIGVDLCLEELKNGEAGFRGGADDQSIITGYAVDIPGTNYLPPEHWLAWRMARRLEQLRIEKPELKLGPDGKLIVVCEQEGSPSRVSAVSASLQQAIRGPEVELNRAVRALVRQVMEEAGAAIPGFDASMPEKVPVNGAGNFAVGGTEGDNGLSGKKLVVDAYGPRVPIGGGALSGKDFYKVDRAGALIARRIAKAVVRTGAAKACTATVSIFPRDEAFSIVSLGDERGAVIDAGRWAANVRPVACGNRRPGHGLCRPGRHRPPRALHQPLPPLGNAGIRYRCCRGRAGM